MPKVALPRRRLVVTALALLASVALLAGCLTAEQKQTQEMINNSRAGHTLPPFGTPRPLHDYSPADKKAQAWAEKMARDGKISHSNLRDGYAGTSWCHLGENVGMGPSLQSIHNAFMNSPGHRANILSFNYSHMGTGVVKDKTTGYWYVVQEFLTVC